MADLQARETRLTRLDYQIGHKRQAIKALEDQIKELQCAKEREKTALLRDCGVSSNRHDDEQVLLHGIRAALRAQRRE